MYRKKTQELRAAQRQRGREPQGHQEEGKVMRQTDDEFQRQRTLQERIVV